MNNNVTTTLALVNGIGNILTAISILGVIVFLILGLVNGFTDWRKDYLIYSAVGVVAFWVIARICKAIIRNSER